MKGTDQPVRPAEAHAVDDDPVKTDAPDVTQKEPTVHHEQARITELFGKLDWDALFDCKAERSRP